MAQATTDNDFESDVLKSDKPVLVDFWAEWCGPCRQLSPTIDALSEEMKDKVKIVKVDIDKNPDSPTKYDVRGIPTLIIFKDGKPLSKKVGALPKSALIDWINSVIE